LQEAIKLFQEKKYHKAYIKFEKLLDQNSDQLEISKYLYLCKRNLKKPLHKEQSRYINLLFKEQNYQEVIEVIAQGESSISLNEKITLIDSLFKNGQISKAQTQYIKIARELLKQKNFSGLTKLIEFEKNIFKYSPQNNLIKCMYWLEIRDLEKLNHFLTELESDYKKNWKVFRDQRVSLENYIVKITDIIEPLIIESDVIYCWFYYLKIKFLKYSLLNKEKLEYTILTIEDIPKQVQAYYSFNEDEKELYKNYIKIQNLPKDISRQLPQELLSQKVKIDKIQVMAPDIEDIKLRFDRINTDSKNEIQNYSYKVSEAEKKIVSEIDTVETYQESAKLYTELFIENNFLYAALKNAEYLRDEGLKAYLKADIYIRLEKWNDAIDICMKVYEKLEVDKQININYFLGLSYLGKSNKKLALKYFEKVIMINPSYRSVMEKVKIAQT